MNIELYTKLTKPYYHIENIGIHHPEDRPRGKVQIKRVFQFPEGNEEFNHKARKSSLMVLKALQDKPHMAAELTYKLRAHVKDGILIKLTDFLKLPEVVKEEITL